MWAMQTLYVTFTRNLKYLNFYGLQHIDFVQLFLGSPLFFMNNWIMKVFHIHWNELWNIFAYLLSFCKITWLFCLYSTEMSK